MQALYMHTKHPRYADTWPLLHRMTVLRLDPDELADLEPLVFCDLRSACMMCENRQTCERDLADETADLAWQSWRDYCPNSTILTVLSAVRGSRASKPQGWMSL